MQGTDSTWERMTKDQGLLFRRGALDEQGACTSPAVRLHHMGFSICFSHMANTVSNQVTLTWRSCMGPRSRRKLVVLDDTVLGRDPGQSMSADVLAGICRARAGTATLPTLPDS